MFEYCCVFFIVWIGFIDTVRNRKQVIDERRLLLRRYWSDWAWRCVLEEHQLSSLAIQLNNSAVLHTNQRKKEKKTRVKTVDNVSLTQFIEWFDTIHQHRMKNNSHLSFSVRLEKMFPNDDISRFPVDVISVLLFWKDCSRRALSAAAISMSVVWNVLNGRLSAWRCETAAPCVPSALIWAFHLPHFPLRLPPLLLQLRLALWKNAIWLPPRLRPHVTSHEFAGGRQKKGKKGQILNMSYKRKIYKWAACVFFFHLKAIRQIPHWWAAPTFTSR